MKRSMKATAAALAALMGLSVCGALLPANVSAYYDEYGNWIDDDDDLDDFILGLAIADELINSYGYDSYYNDYYDYDYNYYDYYDYDDYYFDNSDYTTYYYTYDYYDDADTYVGYDYYLGSIFYNTSVGYYCYNGNNISFLGYNFKLRTKPTSTGNTITFIQGKLNDDPAYDAGLGFTSPNVKISGYRYSKYRIIGMIYEMQFKSKTGSDNLYFRMAKGFNDISGDNSDYNRTYKWKYGSTTVMLKGYKPGNYHLATWTKNGFTYSLRSEEGLSLKEMQSKLRDII